MNRPTNDTLFQLFVSENGSGEDTLVFLPGMGATTRYWQGRVTELEQSHRVLLVDPLGFGDSPKPWTKYTVARHVDSLQRTLSPHAPFTLIGHSMGAVLSVAYAARYPEQVERLILMGIPYFGDREQTYQHFRNGTYFDRYFLTNVGMAAVFCMMSRRVFGRILPLILRDIPREIAEDLVKHSWRSFTSSLWEVIYNHDLKAAVERLDPNLPVYCLHGEQDQTAPLSGVQQLAAERPNWHIEVLPDTDHHPWLRQLERCTAVVEKFLAIAKQPSPL